MQMNKTSSHHKKTFEVIEHTADLKVRVYGKTKSELFVHALQAMFQCMGPKSDLCRKENDQLVCDQLPVSREVGVNSTDVTVLLVDFLSDALYLSDVHDEAYLDAQILQLNDIFVQATLKGVSVTGFTETEIKAVTYHDMHLQLVGGLWQVDIVFDI